MQELINEFRVEYGNKPIEYQIYDGILNQFSRFDIRCQLDEDKKKEIYSLLIETKQQVTYQLIEVIVFEYLLQQPIEQKEQQIPQNIGQYAQKIPHDMLQDVTTEFIQQFTNFFKLIINRFGNGEIGFNEIQELANDVKKQLKINTVELTRFIQPFINENNLINSQDILLLINDLEKMQISAQGGNIKSNSQQQQQQEQQQQQKQSQIEQEENNDLINNVYRWLDAIEKKKLIQKEDGIRILQEVWKNMKILEKAYKSLEEDADQKYKLLEQLLIEKELSQSSLQQMEYDVNQKTQDLQNLLLELDALQQQYEIKEEQNLDLLKHLNNYKDQLKEVSKYETEIKGLQESKKEIIEKNTKLQKEIERVQETNKGLMNYIKQLEEDQYQDQEPKKEIQEVQTIVYQESEELKNENEQLRIKIQELREFNQKIETEMIDLKREVVHYRNLYDNINRENQQLRSSIMPRTSLLRPSNLPNSNNRQSTLRIGTSQKISFIGRSSIQQQQQQQQQLKISIIGRQSNLQRNSNISSIRGNTVHTFQGSIYQDQPDQLTQIQEENEIQDQTMLDGGNNNNNKNQMIFDITNLIKKEDDIQQQDKVYEFDENSIYTTDYLGIRDEKKIADIFKLERRIHNVILQRCFSDSIYRIDYKGKKSRRVLFITEFTIYVFEGEQKPQKLSKQFPIENLKTIIFAESSPVLCCLQIEGSDDYLIETFKRSELNQYLTEIFGYRKLNLYELDFRLSFKIRFQGQKELIPIEKVQGKQGYLDHGKMSAYKVSSNKGWLWLYTKSLFHKDWQEIFVLLTNVGLIVFKKPGDLEPIMFISLVDALVIKNPITDHQRQHIFKIRYESSKFEFLFSTQSATELDQWHELIHQVIVEQVKQQKKQLDEQQEDIVKKRTQQLQIQNINENN